MNENINNLTSCIFLMAIGILFVLAGVFKWQYPLAFRWEAMTDSRKMWVRVIKIVVGVIIIVATLMGLFEKLL